MALLNKCFIPFAGILCIITMWACTPKVTEPIVVTPEPIVVPEPEIPLSPCAKFSDAPNKDDAETSYVLYRDFLKVKDYDGAFAHWKKVYKVSPAADGLRKTVFTDGMVFYKHYYNQTNNTAYIDSIYMMYDDIEKCYPDGGYVNGRRAFDAYYSFPDYMSQMEIYELFKASITEDGLDAQDFIINPFTALLTELYDSSMISMEIAQTHVQQINETLAYNLTNCEGRSCERWNLISEYAVARLEYFEGVKDFYDCDYYIEKYYPSFESHPDSCEVATEVLSRLNWGGCAEGMPQYDAVSAYYKENCVKTRGGLAGEAFVCMQDGDYNCAIDKFLQAAEEETDNMERKSEILLLVSKIYYVHKKRFSTARTYALQAASVRPNWGEPYILIGRMYASSGPLCGPGRGWDSQIVTWAAIDMWNKAKSIDSSASSEARKWINQYSQYMPKKEDIFFRNLKAGESYFIPCWIQRSTRIRTSD